MEFNCLNKRIVVTLGLSALLAACSQNEDNINKADGSVTSDKTVSTTAAPNKPWKPFSYSPENNSIDYKQNNVKEFVFNLIKLSDKLEKDQYETLDEYKNRLRNGDVSPFSRSEMYLVGSDTNLAYNADAQRYEDTNGPTCLDELGCSIARFEDSKGYYEGHNSFGVYSNIEKLDKYSVNLRPSKLSLKHFGKKSYISGYVDLISYCPMDRESARKNKQKNVYIGYIIKPLSFKIDTEIMEIFTPSVREPREGYDKDIIISADVLGYVCSTADGNIFYKSKLLDK